MDDWKKVLTPVGVTEKKAARPQRRKRPVKLVLSLVGGLLLASLCVWLGTAVHRVYFYDRIYPGVSALNIDLGRMTKAEATAALATYSANFYGGKQLILTYGPTRLVISAKDVSLRADASAAAETAYAYGRTGGFFTRYKASLTAPPSPIAAAGVTYDRAKLEAKIAEFALLADQEHKNFGYKLDDRGLTVFAGQQGITVNKSELAARLSAMLDEGLFGTVAVEPVITPSAPPDWALLRDTFYTAPQDAYVEKSGTKGYRVMAGVAGKDIDMEQLAKDMREPGWIDKFYPFIFTDPALSSADLTALLFRDALGVSVTTLNVNEINRTTNVRLAAEKVHEVVLMPGEEFSFNKIVGQRTEARGFKAAKVFAQGEVVDDVGGGICQVSSALYMTTLYAELEVAERATHAFAVSYVPVGQDATVQWGYLDYRFVNNTAMPLRISAVLDGGTLTIRFYGTKENPARSVKLESTVTETIPFETKRVANAALAAGETREVQRGNFGYRSETYQVIYEGDKEVERRLANKSYYSSQPQILQYGP